MLRLKVPHWMLLLLLTDRHQKPRSSKNSGDFGDGPPSSGACSPCLRAQCHRQREKTFARAAGLNAIGRGAQAGLSAVRGTPSSSFPGVLGFCQGRT